MLVRAKHVYVQNILLFFSGNGTELNRWWRLQQTQLLEADVTSGTNWSRPSVQPHRSRLMSRTLWPRIQPHRSSLMSRTLRPRMQPHRSCLMSRTLWPRMQPHRSRLMPRSLLACTQGLRFGARCLNPAMQPRLLLLPIFSHGLTTATVFSWVHLILSSNLSRKLKTFLHSRSLGTPHHHSTPLLEKKLHWVPISERTKYKVACMCFSAINGSGPAYLSELLHVYSPFRTENSTMLMQDS